MIDFPLDPEEQELLESIENDEWQSIPNVEQEIQRFKYYASEQIFRQKIERQISRSNDSIE